MIRIHPHQMLIALTMCFVAGVIMGGVSIAVVDVYFVRVANQKVVETETK